MSEKIEHATEIQNIAGMRVRTNEFVGMLAVSVSERDVCCEERQVLTLFPVLFNGIGA